MRSLVGFCFLFLTWRALAADFEPHNLAIGARPAAGQNSAAKAKTGAVSATALQTLAQRAESELRGNILPFWLKHTRNPANGGFHGVIDAQMQVRPNAPRGALLTARILWTFSAAYRLYREPEYLEMAQWAYRDLTEHFLDPEFGGLFWTITAEGKPDDTRKQVYGQVFGIYGLAEYFRATGDQRALDQAIAIYRLVETHARDPKAGGYFDAFDRKWTRSADRGNLLGRAPKSQNSHIHILEAYTALLRAWPDAGLRDAQRALIDVLMTHIIDAQTNHLILFLKADWTPVSDEISYGHDIELSWLLLEAAEVLGDEAVIAKVKPLSEAIARATLVEGVDTDGGVINEGKGSLYTDTNKDWWPQAEAAVGFLNAYEISADPKYFHAAQRSWQYIEDKFVDRKYGDWIESVTRAGEPIPRAKVTTWKCPYHSGRACMELFQRLRRVSGERAGE